MALACHGEEQPVPQGEKPSLLCAVGEAVNVLLLNSTILSYARLSKYTEITEILRLT